MKSFKKFYKAHTVLVIGVFVAVLAAAGGGAVLARQNMSQPATVYHNGNGSNGNGQHGSGATDAEHEENAVAPLPASAVSNNPSTAEKLTYLIEEEKLAHDVYQALYDKWGSRVFSNIIKSEANHQSEVLAVMTNRGIADPRSSKVGIFANHDLQSLYNKLVTQGKQSATEAYKVGVAIEELDISDIEKDLATLDSRDTDVKATLENLMAGSKRHLDAFNRQLSR